MQTVQAKRAYQKEWSKRNLDKVHQYGKKHYYKDGQGKVRSREAGRKWRELNREKLRAYKRKWQTTFRKKTKYEYDKAYRIKNKGKLLARYKIRYALKTGKIKRQNCRVCGKDDTQAHHPDYRKPLKVQWLCAICHGKLHRFIEK